LTWQYQPDHITPSWAYTIKEQRRRISDHLRKNPSLQPKIPEAYEEAYSYAIGGAARETGLDEDRFPTQCPWPYEQAMDAGFWPGPGEMGQGSQ